MSLAGRFTMALMGGAAVAAFSVASVLEADNKVNTFETLAFGGAEKTMTVDANNDYTPSTPSGPTGMG